MSLRNQCGWALLLVALLPAQVFGISLDVVGDTLDITNNLPSEPRNAGAYYVDGYFESTSSAATLNITAAPDTPTNSNSECGATNPAWKISVAVLGTPPVGLQLFVRRTGQGSSSAIYGGSSYMLINTSPQTFFCGNGNISSIPLQFKIDGLDINDGHGNKNWEINYQVDTL